MVTHRMLPWKGTWEGKGCRVGCSSLPCFPVWFHCWEEMSHLSVSVSRQRLPAMHPPVPCVSPSPFSLPDHREPDVTPQPPAP